MEKKQAIKTSLEYLVRMKDYLGDEKTEDFINKRFSNVDEGTRKKIIGRVHSIHSAKGASKPMERPQIPSPKVERKPKNKFSI